MCKGRAIGNKNQFPFTFNWQSANPQTGFLPVNQKYGGGSAPSGVIAGVMTGTNIIYTNILPIARMDNHGVVVSWTGSPVGTLSVLVSDVGLTWPSLTFTFQQPAGAAGYMGLSFNQLPYGYLMFQYVNSSGSGTITISEQLKDVN